jgi:hypothetical protein
MGFSPGGEYFCFDGVMQCWSVLRCHRYFFLAEALNVMFFAFISIIFIIVFAAFFILNIAFWSQQGLHCRARVYHEIGVYSSCPEFATLDLSLRQQYIDQMTTKENIISTLKSHKSELLGFGVQNIGLFGSYARNEQSDKSDIDLLIDFQPEKENFDNYMAV